MLTDIQIAQQASPEPIERIAAKAGIPEDALMRFGKYKAKIEKSFIDSLKDRPDGRLVLVTAITPTAAGEGKTTVTVGLGQFSHFAAGYKSFFFSHSAQSVENLIARFRGEVSTVLCHNGCEDTKNPQYRGDTEESFVII